MTLLVTGGAGFIGANFVLYWAKHHPQDEIRNLDALTYAGNLANLDSLKNNSKYKFFHGDICDRSLVEEVMRGCDVVVHFAAESHVDRSILDASSFVRTNVFGTQTMLEAARSLQISRFHHVSTDEVFGSLELGSNEKFSEKTPYNPHSPYSASKASSDHFVRAYGDTYGLPYTMTNCSNNYGPYQFPEKFFGLAITNILEGKKVPVYTPGNQVRDWLYVEDHVRAIEAVLERGKIGETYCVGGLTEDVSNMQALQLILKEMGMGEEVVEYVKDRPAHDVRYAIDWTKINRELGWAPSVTLEEGIRKTVQWFKENEQWWKSVKSGVYQDFYTKQYGQKG